MEVSYCGDGLSSSETGDQPEPLSVQFSLVSSRPASGTGSSPVRASASRPYGGTGLASRQPCWSHEKCLAQGL